MHHCASLGNQSALLELILQIPISTIRHPCRICVELVILLRLQWISRSPTSHTKWFLVESINMRIEPQTVPNDSGIQKRC